MRTLENSHTDDNQYLPLHMSASDPKRNMIRGAIWTVGTRWLIKGIGFLNTIIMARLLMPEDYGIVAMGMLIVGMTQTFLDFGATTALLRKEKVSQDEVDSAWTLRLIQGCVAAVVLIVLPPLAVAYFEEPRLRYILWAFAASVLLASASSIGPTLALREFNFALNFKIDVASKFVSVIATLIAGYFIGDYRALVLGIMAGYLTPLVLGYALHPYRPHWQTSKIGEIWLVTKWLLLANIGNFILRKGDELAAGRLGTTSEYGLYNVGSDLGQLPVAEVGPAMMRAILPVLSSIEGDVERTNKAVIKITATVNSVVWPLGLGFAAIGAQATELILGAKWLAAVPYVQVFAIVAVLQTITSPAKSLLIIRGHTRIQSHAVWAEFLTFCIASVLLVPHFHLIGLAFARLIASATNSIYILIVAQRRCALSLREMGIQIARPMVGAILMMALVANFLGTASNPILQLIIGVAAGIVFVTLWSLISWHLAGRPEGLESTSIDKFQAVFNRTFN